MRKNVNPVHVHDCPRCRYDLTAFAQFPRQSRRTINAGEDTATFYSNAIAAALAAAATSVKAASHVEACAGCLNDAEMVAVQASAAEAVAAARGLRKARLRLRRAQAAAVAAADAAAAAAAEATCPAKSRDSQHASFDVTPIPVETAEGRAWYRREQEALWRKATPLRAELIAAYSAVLDFDQMHCTKPSGTR